MCARVLTRTVHCSRVEAAAGQGHRKSGRRCQSACLVSARKPERQPVIFQDRLTSGSVLVRDLRARTISTPLLSTPPRVCRLPPCLSPRSLECAVDSDRPGEPHPVGAPRCPQPVSSSSSIHRGVPALLSAGSAALLLDYCFTEFCRAARRLPGSLWCRYAAWHGRSSPLCISVHAACPRPERFTPDPVSRLSPLSGHHRHLPAINSPVS